MSIVNKNDMESSESNLNMNGFGPFTDASDSGWKSLCRIGGVAALIQLVCSLITLIVVITLGGEPSTVKEYFTVLHNDRIVGILRMDFPSVINVAFYFLTFFGLYAALRKANGAFAVLAMALAFVGIMLWLATHSALSMIYLSDQYLAATTDAQRAQLFAAGEAIIASDMWHSTGAVIGGIFLQSATVLISLIMLQSKIFSKVTAYVGILTHGLDLAHIIIGIFAPGVGIILMFIAGPLYLIWFPLVGRRLIQLGGSKP